MPQDYTNDDIRALIQANKVHRKVYTDASIFELEKQRIFTHCWNYLCHESQLPNTGDFITTTIAGQSVIVIRAEDGVIKVLANRCSHRGAKLLEQSQGSCKLLRCPYHGWSFNICGQLQAIPCEENYQQTELQSDRGRFNLAELQSDCYRGFVFASLIKQTAPLVEFLGPAKRSLDNMLDRSPVGEIEPVRGVFRAVYRNNWKIYIENLHDGMHPLSVHQSSISASQRQAENLTQQGKTIPLAVQLVQANAQPYESMQELEVSCFAYGHSDMRGFRQPDKENDAVVQAYHEAHKQAYGEEQSAAILGMNLHNVNFYPNFSAHPRFLQMRVITPLAVDRTAIEIKVFKWKGVPEEINQRNIVYANTVHSPASLIKPDDLEAYRRVQQGLVSQTEEWISQHSLYKADNPQTVDSALSEHYIRNQYQAWLQYMCVAS